MKNKKKVVLLIVEGDSEESLLYNRLRTLFKQHEIFFEVQRGDILFGFNKTKNPIKGLIGDKVKQFLNERKFKVDDMLAVLHIIDTDGCLIEDNSVVIDETQESFTRYKESCITVSSEKQRQYILWRNEERKRNIRTMNSVDGVLSGKVLYRMFYFSRNLEHVLFNDPNPAGQGKIDEVEKFIDNLSIPIEAFLEQYMLELSGENIQKDYIESWEKLAQNKVSLQRCTNVPLLFNFIQKETDSLIE